MKVLGEKRCLLIFKLRGSTLDEISQIFYLTGHILDLVELVHFHIESDFYKKYTNFPHRF